MSTVLAEIEQAYYKAIAAVKVTWLYGTEKGPLRYSRDAFLRWAEQIDTCDLVINKADFT